MLWFEIILSALVLIASLFKMLGLPGSTLLFVISCNVLALFYYIFTFFLSAKISLRDIFKLETYKNVSRTSILISIFGGWGISYILIGILFEMAQWVPSLIALKYGILFTVAIAAIVAYMFFKTKDKIYKNLLKRLVIWSIIGGLVLVSTLL